MIRMRGESVIEIRRQPFLSYSNWNFHPLSDVFDLVFGQLARREILRFGVIEIPAAHA